MQCLAPRLLPSSMVNYGLTTHALQCWWAWHAYVLVLFLTQHVCAAGIDQTLKLRHCYACLSCIMPPGQPARFALQ